MNTHPPLPPIEQVFGLAPPPESLKPDEEPTRNFCRQCKVIITDGEEGQYFCSDACKEAYWKDTPPLPDHAKREPTVDDLRKRLDRIAAMARQRRTPVTLKNGTTVDIIADKEVFCSACQKMCLVALTANKHLIWIDELEDGFDVHFATCVLRTGSEDRHGRE